MLKAILVLGADGRTIEGVSVFDRDSYKRALDTGKVGAIEDECIRLGWTLRVVGVSSLEDLKAHLAAEEGE